MDLHDKQRITNRTQGIKNGMHDMHPIVILTYYVGLGLLCIALFHPVYLALSLCMLLLQVFVHGAWIELRQWFIAYLIIAITILLWNPLFSHRGEVLLFYLGGIPIVLEAVIYGFVMMLLIMSVLILFINYNAVMGSLKFLYLFSRYTPKLSVMVAMAVRFVPLLRKRVSIITAVQRTRGISIREGRLVDRLKNGIRILQGVLVWSLEEAMHSADALAAKGYGSGKTRSSYERYRMDLWDRVFLWIMLVLLSIGFIGWFYGLGAFHIYASLEKDLISGRLEWFHLITFFIYLCIPLVMVGKEKLLWRLSR